MPFLFTYFPFFHFFFWKPNIAIKNGALFKNIQDHFARKDLTAITIFKAGLGAVFRLKVCILWEVKWFDKNLPYFNCQMFVVFSKYLNMEILHNKFCLFKNIGSNFFNYHNFMLLSANFVLILRSAKSYLSNWYLTCSK